MRPMYDISKKDWCANIPPKSSSDYECIALDLK